MKIITGFLLMCALSLALPASAEIYKWKDKNGVTRYSDTPPTEQVKQESFGNKKNKPTGKPAAVANPENSAAAQGGKVVGKPTPAGKEPSATPADDLDPEEAAAEQRRRNAESEKLNKQEREKQAKLKEENCKGARSNLESYKQGGRVYKMNENGEREYLGDQELKDNASKAQSEVNEYCN